MIQIGSLLPEIQLYEYIDYPKEGCSLGPQAFDISSELAGKSVVIFAVPGAFTPTCSDSHVPGFLSRVADFKAIGINEIWCLSVNDAFVMNAWGKSLGVAGRLRMVADGLGAFTNAIGLTFDLSSKGLGVRSRRYSMLAVDRKVTIFNLEAGGQLEKSGADTLLEQVRGLF